MYNVLISQAVSGAGLSSKYVVLEFGVDRTPPTGGHVMDGLLLYVRFTAAYLTSYQYVNVIFIILKRFC